MLSYLLGVFNPIDFNSDATVEILFSKALPVATTKSLAHLFPSVKQVELSGRLLAMAITTIVNIATPSDFGFLPLRN